MTSNGNRDPGQPDIFWGEIAPCDHLVQFYEHDNVFMDSLVGFVSGGLRGGEGVIVLATAAHLDTLNHRLIWSGMNLSEARLRDQYITMEVQEVLPQILVNGWPDEHLFDQFVARVLIRARGKGRRVRAFGELVAVMWAQGLSGATVRLEHLWHSLCHKESFSLFCAYPRSGFTQAADASIREICEAHSQVVGG